MIIRGGARLEMRQDAPTLGLGAKMCLGECEVATREWRACAPLLSTSINYKPGNEERARSPLPAARRIRASCAFATQTPITRQDKLEVNKRRDD